MFISSSNNASKNNQIFLGRSVFVYWLEVEKKLNVSKSVQYFIFKNSRIL